ncbi:hypothetical protein [Anaerotignum sp. MB30-C6]|uniref:hypothetical protein n=1 Tax=Anaerotignum sp. MB30-C6 TaxID=3070814 RepID=UPI0027DADD9A|nr:hypothetical protein [Anaerotignum sp. MB30-C6]WMI81319.1 hypothetical protein RBQ60_00890 [Anaerotignum sp. MB30-C6]
MLGFHTDGIRLVGASDHLISLLKQRKLPIVSNITGNTLVFAVNDTSLLTKKLYAPSFSAGEAPWFVCTVGDFPRPTANTLPFQEDSDLADFITAIYYASQGFLHLDFELSELKEKLSEEKGRKIVAIPEDQFGQIPKDAFAMCFCFSNGGFMESDRLFVKLTKEFGMDMGKVLLAGTFDSKHSFIRAFVL